MGKVILVIVLLLAANTWAKGTPLKYGELRQRLLIQAESDQSEVSAISEITTASTETKVDLKLSKYNQKSLKKGSYYRISLVNSFDAYGLQNSKKSHTVYDLLIQELDKKLQPTGVNIHLSAKANANTFVGNFTQQRDELSSSPTLQTGRAQIGDHVINSSPVVLNNENLPAYRKFKVIDIHDEYIPFTLAYRYTLRLRDEKTGRLYDLAAPGLRSLPIWALLVAPENRRVVKFWGGELHY